MLFSNQINSQVEHLLALLQEPVLFYERKKWAIDCLFRIAIYSPMESAYIVNNNGLEILSKFLDDSDENIRETIFDILKELIETHAKPPFLSQFDNAFKHWVILADRDYSTSRYPLRLIYFLSNRDKDKQEYLIEQIIPKITSLPQLFFLTTSMATDVVVKSLQQIILLKRNIYWLVDVIQQNEVDLCINSLSKINPHLQNASLVVLTSLSLYYPEILIEKQILNALENFLRNESLYPEDVATVLNILLNLSNRYGLHDDTKTLDKVKEYFKRANEIKEILSLSEDEKLVERFSQLIKSEANQETALDSLIEEEKDNLVFLQVSQLYSSWNKNTILVLAEIIRTANYEIEIVNEKIKNIVPFFPGIEGLLNHGRKVASLDYINAQELAVKSRFIFEETEHILQKLRQNLTNKRKEQITLLGKNRFLVCPAPSNILTRLEISARVDLLNLMAFAESKRKLSSNILLRTLTTLSSLIEVHADKTENYIQHHLPRFCGVASILEKIRDSQCDKAIIDKATEMLDNYSCLSLQIKTI